ncbi:putative LPS assembly protein LptD [Fulvivirga sediminis]|uniref:LPS-assembly protein LptD n=1 Tax=Fulvivirga sediminis TaxID=2803949 RepID=A0A937F932_9BACT|nr:putative LPS assembly protein LptD [Fulvivirga sediminis]MBL3656539.1 LPS-assembly protein LptD [Fulvivirga sediminis]
MKFWYLAKHGLLLVFFGFFIALGHAQTPEKNISTPKEVLGNENMEADTISNNSDSTAFVADSTKSETPKSDIETTINYSARDSINFSVDSKIVKLYGDAKIDYGAIKLEADHIEIDYNNHTLTAHGKEDSLGRKVGYPIFKNGAETYETKDISYNFKTGEARISEVVTQQGEGYLHGETVYKNSKDELFSINNTYTTCDLAHPHYRIRARKTKAIPNDKIVSGPFNLEINDVPTPLGFIFGMFPAKNEASSGIIIPSYGEERRRGFYLRGGGYFFDISEYVKIAVRGDVYSKGGHGVHVNSVYKKRYAYNGNVNFDYTKLRLSNNIEDEDTRNDYRLAWSHSPQSKGNSRFSASVNAATSSYNTNNYLGINTPEAQNSINNFTRKLSSNISYSKTFQGTPFSLGLSMRHNQDVQTREVDLLLPSLTFNMSNIYPFKNKNGASNSWVEKINVRYSLTGTNTLTNNLGKIGSDPTIDSIAPFDFQNFGTFLENSNKGLQHRIPLSTSFKVLKHFTASPSINYTENWYFDKLAWELDEDNPNQAVVADTINGFNRVYEYNFSTSFSTRLYGFFNLKKGKVKIRHVMNPNISLSYRPDFGAEKYGYYQELTTEEGETILRSRYQGYAYGAPSYGESGSISFSLNNSLEMKNEAKTDSTNKATKVPILNNFGFNTAYNFVADSFKLSNITFRANTSVFKKKVNINLTGTVDPYVYVLNDVTVNSQGDNIYDQDRIDQYTWNNGQGLGQLSNANLAISTNLNPSGQKSDEKTRERINNSDLNQADKDFLLNNSASYVDFTIPWSLRVNYSFNYSKVGFRDAKITQTVRLSGDFSLSEKWKVTFNTGYDFEEKAVSLTNFGISRDLHCWEMNMNWTPFGVYTNYNFTIRVKSSLLQDLKLNRTRSFYDN